MIENMNTVEANQSDLFKQETDEDANASVNASVLNSVLRLQIPKKSDYSKRSNDSSVNHSKLNISKIGSSGDEMPRRNAGSGIKRVGNTKDFKVSRYQLSLSHQKLNMIDQL